MSPFTGRKKQKAWNKSREKYMPVKRRQNLAETGRGSYYKEEWLEEFLDSKGNEIVMKVIIMMRVMIKIMNSSSYRRVLLIVATK